MANLNMANLKRQSTKSFICFLHCGLDRAKKNDSCVQVSEVKKIRVGRSKNICIFDFFFITNVQRL